jgi:DNA-binding NarL/FixJ family response regulator
LKSQSFDLILLDIILPDGNGFDICRKIHGLKKHESVPVIFLSALVNLEEKKKAFEAGGIDYITKPFDDREVLLRIQNQLKIKENDQKLNEQIKLNNMIINNIPFGLFLIDSSCKAVLLNDWFENRHLTLKSDGWLDFIDFVFEPSRNSFKQAVKKVFENKKNMDLEMDLIQDQSLKLHTNLSMLYFENNNDELVFGMVEDISDRKKIMLFQNVLVDSLKKIMTNADDFIQTIEKQKVKVEKSDLFLILNEKEKEIIRLIFEGKMNKEIAGKLNVSDIYIRKKVSEIYKKLKIRSRYELINLMQ